MYEDLSESFLFSSASALPRKIRLLTGNEQRAVRAAAVEAAAKLFEATNAHTPNRMLAAAERRTSREAGIAAAAAEAAR